MTSLRCDICRELSATHVCRCKGKESRFCAVCNSNHLLKDMQVQHLNMPVEIYEMQKRAERSQAQIAQAEELRRKRGLLLQELTSVDQFTNELSTETENIVQAIRARTQLILRNLQEDKARTLRTIEAAVEEAEKVVNGGGPPSADELVRWLIDPGAPSEMVSGFTYSFEDQADVLNSFCRYGFLKFKLPTELPSAFIPAICKGTLELYDVSTRRVTNTYKLAKEFSLGTVFCPLDQTRVLCIGGGGGLTPYLRVCCEVNLNDGSLKVAADMQQARGWAGVVRAGQWIYAFGGNNPRITTAEKYSITGNQWTQVSSMSEPRYSFNPILYKSGIFLIEQFQFTRAELFNLASETYSTVNISLPPTGCHAMSFPLQDKIVFLSREMLVWKWNIVDGTTSASALEGNTVWRYIYSNCPPVIRGYNVYVVLQETGKVVVFDISSNILA